MAYNGRMSMARSSAHSSAGQSRTKKPVEEDSYGFKTLEEKDLVEIFASIGIPCAEQTLSTLRPEHVQRIFEWFAELLTMTTREVVAPGMRAAAEDACGEEADRLFTADTRELMGFFVMLRRLLAECGVNDFTFADLFTPTRTRLIRIFSCVINFIRFRESQTGIIDQQYTRLDRTKDAVERLYAGNEAKALTLEEMQRNATQAKKEMRDKEARVAELTTYLRQMSEKQRRTLEDYNRNRDALARQKSVLEERSAAAAEVRRDADKLRPYTQASPATLEQNLRELQEKLAGVKSDVERLERRERALRISGDTFSLVTGDVNSLTKILDETAAELRAEEQQAAGAGKVRDTLSERSNNVRDVERQERLLNNKLASWTERTEKLRKGAEEKQIAARARTDELRAVHEELGRERRVRGEEVERRRVRIETVEKKMADLKENIEKEVQSAREEYMTMASHIQLYMTEMDKNLVC